MQQGRQDSRSYLLNNAWQIRRPLPTSKQALILSPVVGTRGGEDATYTLGQ